ncbi:MAG TPA: hypothetical protein DCM87_12245 [Planctomycetes bacterium]|nr:hypothetical protein [Planctomycetota bacterium]
MSPRQSFQLACRIVGLVLLCQGIIAALGAVALFFHDPDAARMLPAGVAKTLPPEYVGDLRAAASYVWKHAMEQLLLTGIIPMVLGGYLLRAENIVVRLCYPKADAQRPDPRETGGEPGGDAVQSAPPGRDTATDESRYAPPGYGARAGTA